MDFFKKSYDYEGNWDIPGYCYLYINNNLVIATQAPDNHSTSITNMGRRLPEMISGSESIDINSMIYIEHYGANESDNDFEQFWLINLNDTAAIPSRITLDIETIKSIDKLISEEHLSIKFDFV